jgi:hypothetical protein
MHTGFLKKQTGDNQPRNEKNGSNHTPWYRYWLRSASLLMLIVRVLLIDPLRLGISLTRSIEPLPKP